MPLSTLPQNPRKRKSQCEKQNRVHDCGEVTQKIQHDRHQFFRFCVMRLFVRRTLRVRAPPSGAGAGAGADEPAPAAVGRGNALTGPVALPRAPAPRLDILAFKIAWIFRKSSICFARTFAAIFALIRCFCAAWSQFSGDVLFLNVPFGSVRLPVPDISTYPIQISPPPIRATVCTQSALESHDVAYPASSSCSDLEFAPSFETHWKKETRGSSKHREA